MTRTVEQNNKMYQCRECDFKGSRYEISQHYRWKHPKAKKYGHKAKTKTSQHKLDYQRDYDMRKRQEKKTMLHPGLNYCPHCGLNLSIINAAMSIKGI